MRSNQALGRFPARLQPQLEVLEGRALPAVLFNAATGVLSINGTPGNDVAVVTIDDRATPPVADDRVIAHGTVGFAHLPRWAVTQIVFDAGDGDDRFHNQTPIAAIALGGKGNDQFHGGSGIDRLYGGEGHDYLCGGSGADKLSGDSGNDRLCGDAGDDWMDGGTGNDLLNGGTGADHLFGRDGNDRLIGDEGDDWLDGGAGADLLQGLAGNDHLDGGNDAAGDFLFGGDGADDLVWHPADVRDWIANGPAVPPG
jgi:Ca2+-binding RTX toxin-like protein